MNPKRDFINHAQKMSIQIFEKLKLNEFLYDNK